MMANIFNAQLHLAFEVQLMAFKFLDLVVQYYPSSFSLYSEKVCNYGSLVIYVSVCMFSLVLLEYLPQEGMSCT